MLTQSLELQTVPAIPALPIFIHIVTLRHPTTGDECTLEIETPSDRFVDVYRAVCWQRAEQRLFGYQIFEVLDLNNPF